MLNLPPTADPEAAAFFAAARATLLANPPQPCPVTRSTVNEPALSDLTGMPQGPTPDQRLISVWSAESFDRYFTAVARQDANRQAEQAGERQHTAQPSTVLGLLASAEEFAPETDRTWHAARLNAYANAHGLRGWYRTTRHGKRIIQINAIRTRTDGNRGRYFIHIADRMHGPARFWVVDRDTGRTAHQAPTAGIAKQWIDQREAFPSPLVKE